MAEPGRRSGIDTKLANACLDYLNFDRLGVDEVHAYLPGGAKQLHRWLAENGRDRRVQLACEFSHPEG
jgi:hypothetical protein